jgi:hypothetical protein
MSTLAEDGEMMFRHAWRFDTPNEMASGTDLKRAIAAYNSLATR